MIRVSKNDLPAGFKIWKAYDRYAGEFKYVFVSGDDPAEYQDAMDFGFEEVFDLDLSEEGLWVKGFDMYLTPPAQILADLSDQGLIRGGAPLINYNGCDVFQEDSLGFLSPTTGDFEVVCGKNAAEYFRAHPRDIFAVLPAFGEIRQRMILNDEHGVTYNQWLGLWQRGPLEY